MENLELNELCSRKLLDMYQKAEAANLKSAIEAELMKREHFISTINNPASKHR